MASLIIDPSGNYHLRFRLDGHSYKRSLDTKDQREAVARMARAEELIRLLKRRLVQVPDGVDPGEFIVTDGKVKAPAPPQKQALTLGGLFKAYEAEYTPGAKEDNTRYTEKVHGNHLQRHLGADTHLALIDGAKVQAYIDRRT